MSQRTIKGLFALLIVSMVSFSLFAQSIVVEEEAAPAESPTSGYEGGFFVRSPDKNFQLTINGRVQPQFIFTQTKVKTAQGKTAETFFVRRGQFSFSTSLFEKVETTVLLVHNSKSGMPVRPIAELVYHVHPKFHLTMGMVQLPMDRMGEGSSGWMQMIDGPLTATQEDGSKDMTMTRQSFGLPYDLGIRLDGELGEKFSYAVGLGNGSGAWTANNPNDAFSVGMRVAYDILKKVPGKEYVLGGDEEPMLSVGFGTGIEDENASDTVTTATGTATTKTTTFNRDWRWTVSTDVAFRWNRWSLTTEGYHRVEDYEGGTTFEDADSDGKLTDYGYYLQAGYFIVPKKIQVVALMSQIFREGPDNNANEFGAGVNWYIHKNNVKLQFDYTNVLDYDDIFGLSNNTQHKFRAMLTAQF